MAADCNSNGVDDTTDITVGTSFDCNVNGIPDDCELQPEFSDTQVIGLMDRPLQAIATDIDGDGDADVVAGGRGNPTMVWYENIDGLGSFGGQQVISLTFFRAVAMMATDLDGDGDEDLLTSSPVSGTSSIDMVTWYRNVNGMGDFVQMPVIANNSFGNIPIFASDLDNDGDMDVLAGLTFQGKVAWFENIDGTGKFGPQRSVSTNVISAESLYTADLDGDGDQDVIAADQFYNRIVWYENNDGLGHFNSRIFINNDAFDVEFIISADIDGDGDADVASAGEDGDKIAWYENTDGMGTFGPRQVVTSSATRVSRVSAADMDGDGDTDLLWAALGNTNIAYNDNTPGDGLFAAPQVITSVAVNPSRIVAADLDRDGDPDVLATSLGDDAVAWHENSTFDCNGNSIPDECDVASGTSLDCNGNGTPDECEPDCNATGFPDDCDVLNQTSEDCNTNGYPDECELDCNASGAPDTCDVANQTSIDCNFNNFPDECELINNDCDSNGVPDDCTLALLTDSLSGPVNTFACPKLPAELTVSIPLEGLEYQWFNNGVPLIEGDDAIGTNTGTLTFPNANMGDEGLYYCEVTLGCISIVTDSVSLLLLEPLNIVQQPSPSTTFCTGNVVTLAVEATGENLTYEWLQNGEVLQEQPGKYENVDSAILRIIDAGASDVANYACIVRDSCGAEETTIPSLLETGSAVFTEQPVNQCVSANDTIAYSASAEAGPNFVLSQWYKDGAPLTDGGNISGSSADTLVIQNVSAADEGSYTQRAVVLGPNCISFSNVVELQIDSCVCTTPGDMDADGDLDLVDLQAYMDCFGANIAERTACACGNLNDVDSVIDLNDWTEYANLLTGP